jgi:hypothetical protein
MFYGLIQIFLKLLANYPKSHDFLWFLKKIEIYHNLFIFLFKKSDHHDAWHLLSALSMFMLFVSLLTLDDGIITKRRSEISVF